MTRLASCKARTARQMSQVESAWLGAFLDGEGTIGFYGSNQGRQRYLEISVSNTEVELIATVLRVAGTGLVYGKQVSLNGSNPSWLWTWAVRVRADTYALVEQLAPYCLKAQRALA